MGDEEFSNSSDYAYMDDLDYPETGSGSNWWWTEHLPELVWTGMWMFLFVVSLVANLVSLLQKKTKTNSEKAPFHSNIIRMLSCV